MLNQWEHLELQDWLHQLPSEERDRITAILAGEDDSEAATVDAKRIAHQLAIIGHLSATCTSCHLILPADAFGWNQWPNRLCLSCEPSTSAEDRRNWSRWVRDVRRGAVWHCLACDQLRPTAAFYRKSHSRCRSCTLASQTAPPPPLTDWRCGECGHTKPASEFPPFGRWRCTACVRTYHDRYFGKPKKQRKRAKPTTRDERKHGTYVKYKTDGCRCEACRAANTRTEKKRRERIHPPYPPRSCGTASAYKRGCRCERCRAYTNDIKRRYYRRRKDPNYQPRTLIPCPSSAAYARGCRCDGCRKANAVKQREYAKKRARR